MEIGEQEPVWWVDPGQQLLRYLWEILAAYHWVMLWGLGAQKAAAAAMAKGKAEAGS